LITFCKRSAAFKKLQEVLQKGAKDKDAATDSESAPGVFTDLLTVQGSDVAKANFPNIEPEVFEDYLRFTHKDKLSPRGYGIQITQEYLRYARGYVLDQVIQQRPLHVLCS